MKKLFRCQSCGSADPWHQTNCFMGQTYNSRLGMVDPVVFLPLMTKPAREVEKGIKYLPEVWRPNER